ncbi:MAG: polysaccharide biosynthesis tyrosine autokinase [Deltaproteobacteria bacterium]|nr:polysaccharide biosynthesis tyrosine autokinase [Deltaproteobacteria bacterium]
MSKIHLALEKAEKERVAELNKKAAVSAAGDRPLESYPWPVTNPLVLEQSNIDKSLVAFYQPHSIISEQFRKLRTHLLRLNFSRSVKTIMVTSAVQGEGKSFVAANLAIGIAYDLHLHSLLVDCDLRNPNVGSLFGISNGNGIADYLIGRGSVADILVKTDLEKLSLIPSGTVPTNPSEIIGSNRMTTLVEELKTRYDDRFIVFDSTPLLATSDSGVLAKLVDGIILVVRAGSTPRETITQALTFLEKDKILGVVLNHVQFKAPGLFRRYFGASGYYAKNQYGYGQGKKNRPQVHKG